jgi:hypothetical protein
LIFIAPPAKAGSDQESGMADVGGKWNCMVASPMGEQQFVLTVNPDGERFTGSASGSIGGKEIPDGTIDGDTLKWTMRVTSPMPLTLACSATVSADTLDGSVTAGFLGRFPISGTRG